MCYCIILGGIYPGTIYLAALVALRPEILDVWTKLQSKFGNLAGSYRGDRSGDLLKSYL